jgi:hypothetical protein
MVRPARGSITIIGDIFMHFQGGRSLKMPVMVIPGVAYLFVTATPG